MGTSSNENLPPAKNRILRDIALGLGLILFFSWSAVVYSLWTTGGWYYLGNGDIKTGDIFKHYAAGNFVAAHAWLGLYNGNRFLEWEREDRRFLQHEALVSTQVAPPIRIRPDNFPEFEDHFYVYPPLVALFASPFIHIDFFTISNAWFALSILFYAVAWIICRRTQPELKLWTLLPSVYFWAMPSFFVCLWILQNSTLTLLFIVWAAARLNRGRDIEAGLILSALFYKPQILVFVLIFMLAAKQYRFVATLATASALWLLVGVVICGGMAYSGWLAVLSQKIHLHRLENYYVGISPISLYTFFYPHSDTPVWLIPLLSAFGFLLTAWLGWRMRNFIAERDWQPSFLLYVAVALWAAFSPVVFFYDWLLTLPWFFVIASYLKDRVSLYLLVGAYVLIVNGLHLTLTYLYPAPPFGAILCPLWMAASVALMLQLDTSLEKKRLPRPEPKY